LSTYFSPSGASQETVFIPRIVDNFLSPDVFSVIAHAVCGEGGVVATDMVEVNPTTREVVIDQVDETAFAPACVDALRLLGANMAASDQGELFALSVVRGLNHVLTVVGHSDEGGVLRDVLRCGSVGPPFGGVHYGLSEYAGLPALATSEGSAVAGYCDSLLLASAALVAHCDPGVNYNGSWYPTVLFGASSSDPETEPGSELAGTTAHARANKSALNASIGAFAALYCPALAKLFGLPPGGHCAQILLTSAARQLAPECRHLCSPSVAPFYWIEPTSLIPHDFTGYSAELEGFASVVGRNMSRPMKAWEDLAPYGQSDGYSSGYVVRFRGARAAPFLHHFHGTRVTAWPTWSSVKWTWKG